MWLSASNKINTMTKVFAYSAKQHLSRAANLQMGPGILLKLHLISRLLRPVPLEKRADSEADSIVCHRL